MTVSSTSSRVVHDGDGSNTSFPFAFHLDVQADLSVTFTDEDGNETVLTSGQYSINAPAVPPPGWPSGGTVAYNPGSPIATGTTLTLERVVAATQPTTLSNQGAMWPAVIERALDRLVTIVQGYIDGLGRALKFPAVDADPPDDLPPATLRANGYLGFDADGQPTIYEGPAGSVSISTAMTPVVQASSLVLARTAMAVAGLGDDNTLTGTNDLTGGRAQVPTRSPGDNGTDAASTAFVAAALASGATVVRSYLAGLTLSNNSGTPNTKLDVAAGVCADDGNVATLSLSAGTIDCTTTGANGLDGGVLTNSTWYHVFAIARNDGTTALLASTSASAPTMPATYTRKRRLGSFKTDGSAHIQGFVQDGDLFQWKALVAGDVSQTNPGTAAVTRTLGGVPTGVNVQAWLQLVMRSAGGSFSYLLVSDLATTDTAPSFTLTDCEPGGNARGSGAIKYVRTNTSAQVRSRNSYSDGLTILNINTLGWVDRRGRDA